MFSIPRCRSTLILMKSSAMKTLNQPGAELVALVIAYPYIDRSAADLHTKKRLYRTLPYHSWDNFMQAFLASSSLLGLRISCERRALYPSPLRTLYPIFCGLRLEAGRFEGIGKCFPSIVVTAASRFRCYCHPSSPKEATASVC